MDSKELVNRVLGGGEENMKKHWKVIWEALKEPLRELVLAAIPGVLTYLQTIPAEWAIVLYLVLRAVDSYLHKSGIAEKGLTRF